MKKPTPDEIGALAQLLWEQQGRPENRATDHWLEAEYRLLSRSLVNDPNHVQDETDLRSRGLGSLVPPEDKVGRKAGTVAVKKKDGGTNSLPTGVLICVGAAIGLGGILAGLVAWKSGKLFPKK